AGARVGASADRRDAGAVEHAEPDARRVRAPRSPYRCPRGGAEMIRISPVEARRRRAALERETDEAVERALQIQGLYRRQEARFLYQLARRKGNIVEIGCWMGRTTAILVQAARVWGASVTSIDPFVVL